MIYCMQVEAYNNILSFIKAQTQRLSETNFIYLFNFTNKTCCWNMLVLQENKGLVHPPAFFTAT